MAGRGRDPQAESFWRWVIQLQLQSGLTVKDFCVQEGMSTASFYTWRRKLQASEGGTSEQSSRRLKKSPGQVRGSAGGKKRATVASVRANSPPEKPTLLPVEVVNGTSAAIEVVHPRGHVLRIPPDLFPDPLRRVLELLDGNVNSTD